MSKIHEGDFQWESLLFLHGAGMLVAMQDKRY